MNRTSAYWACQVLGWSLFTAIGAAFSAASVAMTLRIAVAYVIAGCAALVASHVYRWYMRRQGWMALGFAAQIPRLIAGSLIFGGTAGAAAFCSAASVSGSKPQWGFAFAIISSWVMGMVYWSAIYSAVHGVDAYRRTQLIAKDAQLRALLAQVNPHFLFNSLNSMRGLIAEDPAKAQEMVTQFSQVLRYSLDSGKRWTVPLSEELEAVRHYLACEKIRFEGQLTVELDLSSEAMGEQVPPMLIQTLVENGVKHGLAQSVEPGLIRIAARLEGRRLVVQVQNKGRLRPIPGHCGTGLASARERIELLFGPAARLDISESPSGYVTAELLLPCRSK